MFLAGRARPAQPPKDAPEQRLVPEPSASDKLTLLDIDARSVASHCVKNLLTCGLGRACHAPEPPPVRRWIQDECQAPYAVHDPSQPGSSPRRR